MRESWGPRRDQLRHVWSSGPRMRFASGTSKWILPASALSFVEGCSYRNRSCCGLSLVGCYRLRGIGFAWRSAGATAVALIWTGDSRRSDESERQGGIEGGLSGLDLEVSSVPPRRKAIVGCMCSSVGFHPILLKEAGPSSVSFRRPLLPYSESSTCHRPVAKAPDVQQLDIRGVFQVKAARRAVRLDHSLRQSIEGSTVRQVLSICTWEPSPVLSSQTIVARPSHEVHIADVAGDRSCAGDRQTVGRSAPGGGCQPKPRRRSGIVSSVLSRGMHLGCLSSSATT